MPAYHSSHNRVECRLLSGMGLLPITTQYKGPAPKWTGGAGTGEDAEVDIVDEALDFFKANVLFRNYEVKGPADRVLVYLTLYIQQCLTTIGLRSKGDAEKELYQLAIGNFAIPGDRNFVLAGFVSNPKDRSEADLTRQYMLQLRQETGKRLVERMYRGGDGAPSKWWTCFNKKKFLNKAL